MLTYICEKLGCWFQCAEQRRREEDDRAGSSDLHEIERRESWMSKAGYLSEVWRGRNGR